MSVYLLTGSHHRDTVTVARTTSSASTPPKMRVGVRVFGKTSAFTFHVTGCGILSHNTNSHPVWHAIPKTDQRGGAPLKQKKGAVCGGGLPHSVVQGPQSTPGAPAVWGRSRREVRIQIPGPRWFRTRKPQVQWRYCARRTRAASKILFMSPVPRSARHTHPWFIPDSPAWAAPRGAAPGRRSEG